MHPRILPRADVISNVEQGLAPSRSRHTGPVAPHREFVRGQGPKYVFAMSISRRTFLRLGGTGALAAAGLVARSTSPSGASTSLALPLVPPANAREALAALGRTTLRYPESLPFPHLLPGTDTMPQIQHIVMLMMENHSYDNFLGTLQRDSVNGPADGFTMHPSAVTTWNPNGVLAGNPNGKGDYQWAYHMPTTCQHSGSPTQEWSASHQQYNNGNLDGFVTGVSYGESAAGPVAMAYWNARDLPVLHSLATYFPLADRWFQSLLGQTDPNRRYLIAGTSTGMTDDIDISTSGLDERGTIQDLTLPVPANGTIFDLLSAFGISWTCYVENGLTSATPELYPVNDVLNIGTEKPFDEFYADAAKGTLPAFSFLDEDYSTQSQENPQDIVVGEQLIHQVVTTLANSPAWNSTMLILSYDEHGGYYDHVAPPVAMAPDLIPPIVEPGQLEYDRFSRLGFRVPALVISPYSRPNWVTHTVYDHTSVLAMMERKWNLPAMTWRDANANDLMDFLDPVAWAAGKPRSFEELCPFLLGAAPSNCPAVAPKLPLPGTYGQSPLPPH
jgi:phospholipase C